MLNPVKNIKVYEAIIEQIKDSVKNGELKSGDKLPSERELAEKLQVSRTSVREALKALSMLGLIDSKHGDGNFIKSNVEDCLLEPLSVVFLLIGNRNEEIFQLRRIN
ncbi:transcriptional regulator, putative pyruvate dehydrogenase complex repressor [Clostridium sp. IBUN22A]|nr:transcriptional regulator, putative pyruvate dehydrogenase complex repressor [Clostridium sp. IBUN22A]